MDSIAKNILTILIFLPSIGALLVLVPKSKDAVRWTALATTIVTFALSLGLFGLYDWHKGTGYGYEDRGGTVQMVTAIPWIPTFNIFYRVGIDGLSFPL